MVLKNRGCYSIPLFYHLIHNMLCISIIQKHYCSSLTSVVIPSSVTNIDMYSFSACHNLTSVTNFSKHPQKIDADNYFSNTSADLHVLRGYVTTYKIVAGWKEFNVLDDVDYTPEMVTALIDAIGVVEYTAACKAKIGAAREGFDSLPKEKQALVKNHALLTAAEMKYKKLESTGIADINAEAEMKDVKYLENGKIVIVKNGRKYNSNGILKAER